MATNNAGGPYNDAQTRHIRPEHAPQRWAASQDSSPDEDDIQKLEALLCQ